MLQINFIRDNQSEVINQLAVKNFDAAYIVQKIINLDDKRKETQKQSDDKQAESNILAKEIGHLFKEGKANEANEKKEKTAKLKQEVKQLNDQLSEVLKELHDQLIQLPNIPHPSVNKGNTSDDNEIIYEEGTLPSPGENDLPHWDLAVKLKLIDFESGSKITGAGFPVYRGKAAKFQRALVSFFLDEASKAGYEEIQPPLVVNEDSAYGTGQLPDKDGQMYLVDSDGLYLIPTSEVPVTNIYRDSIIKSSDLPVKNTAYSSCFRREAGSYGKDVRGLNRLHQFDKVEIVQIQHPEKSYETLEIMRDYVASLIRKLELPFRISRLCGGDLSFTSALTYDFEVYSAVQRKWLEVSSVSNFESFQANRMKLRFKDENGKTRLLHTLNGSALALPRIVAALFENNQSEKGIKVPEALIYYTGFEYLD
ncbi:serine--tRNA ligase [Bacteroidota bacterium]